MDHQTHGYHQNKEAVLKRLARIEGQVRGIKEMVNNDRYCIDILDQVSACSKALKKVAVLLTKDHLEHCVAESIQSDKDSGKSKIEEAINAIDRLATS
ncbi:MAG: metal-sensitive transcriptional regulator [Acidimicrobiia bacterium]